MSRASHRARVGAQSGNFLSSRRGRFLALSLALAALLGARPGREIVPVTNAQQTPVLSVQSASVNEGNAGTTNAVVTVQLSPASTQTVTVSYRTNPLTAMAGADYEHVTGNLTFSPGATTRTLNVPIIGDTTDEEDEHLFVSLFNAVGAGISVSSNPPLLAILDDDATARNVTLSADTYNFNESTGLATITVNRTGDLSVTSSVNYETRDSAAKERTDYLAAIGTLVFNPGEGSKQINIFLTNDRYDEGEGETFTILLTRPVNTALDGGVTSDASDSATIIIADDDTANGTNPVRASTFEPEFFVRQHYRDFFNREADASGLAFWINQTTNCGDTDLQVCRDNVSGAFFLSIEFQETGFLVYLTHHAAYNRAERLPLRDFLPDTQKIGSGVIVGEADWQARLEANKQAYFAEFAASPQFNGFFPGTLTPAQVVDQLNTNAGNVLTQQERNQLVAELTANNTTQGRASVLRRVAENEAFANLHKNRAFVLMQYFGYLRRNPNDAPNIDFSGYNFWLAKLNEHNGNFVTAQMVRAFITSGEYEERFAP